MKPQYKPFILFTFLLFLSFTAEEKYLMDLRLLPGTTYRILIKMETASTIDLLAEEEILDQLSNRDMQFPLNVENTRETILKMKTGELKSDSSFDVKMQIEEYKNSKVINGIETARPDTVIKGLQMQAVYTKEKKLKILGIESGRLSEELKAALIKVAEKSSDIVLFPDYPLAAGDTFQQKIPLDIPAGADVAIDRNLTLTFTLMDVKDNKARFKINTDAAASGSSEPYTMKFDAGGEGELIHDMELKYPVNYTSAVTMNIEIGYNQYTMISKSTTKTTLQLLE